MLPEKIKNRLQHFIRKKVLTCHLQHSYLNAGGGIMMFIWRFNYCKIWLHSPWSLFQITLKVPPSPALFCTLSYIFETFLQGFIVTWLYPSPNTYSVHVQHSTCIDAQKVEWHYLDLGCISTQICKCNPISLALSKKCVHHFQVCTL